MALDYGVKGIQYFTYWTPEDPAVDFGYALIERDRTSSELYDYAQRANESLRKIGGVLFPLTSDSVTHYGERRLPRGAKAFKGDSYIAAASEDPAILGFFSNPRDASGRWRYVLVVNRSPNQASSTRLTVSSTVKSVERFDEASSGFVTETLTGKPPRFLTASLEAGRAVLYRLSKT